MFGSLFTLMSLCALGMAAPVGSQLSELWKKQILPLIIAFFDWLKGKIPSPTPTPVAGQSELDQWKDMLVLAMAEQSIKLGYKQAAGDDSLGSVLSGAVDWLIERLKALLEGSDYQPIRLELEKRAIIALQTYLVPIVTEWNGLAGTLLAGFLAAELKRVEDLLNPTS